MNARLVRAREGSLIEAAALSEALLDRVEAEGGAWAGTILARGPAVMLGRGQRAERVLDRAACDRSSVAVHRRHTTGTHVFIGPSGAAALCVALPSLSALMPDARPSTALNRNVRGWLNALTAHGALAHYFGREWLSIAKRPGAVLALSERASGAFVIELWIGLEESVEAPSELLTERERGTDRWQSKRPASWAESTGQRAVEPALFDRVQRRALERYGVAVTEHQGQIELDRAALAVTIGDERWRWAEPTPCAIGWIDAALTAESTVWVGGDPLMGDRERADVCEALADASRTASMVAERVAEALVFGADAEAWGRCGAALDVVVRSRSL